MDIHWSTGKDTSPRMCLDEKHACTQSKLNKKPHVHSLHFAHEWWRCRASDSCGQRSTWHSNRKPSKASSEQAFFPSLSTLIFFFYYKAYIHIASLTFASFFFCTEPFQLVSRCMMSLNKKEPALTYRSSDKFCPFLFMLALKKCVMTRNVDRCDY